MQNFIFWLELLPLLLLLVLLLLLGRDRALVG